MAIKSKTIDILGSKWKIIWKDEDKAFAQCDGYTDHPLREIVIKNLKEDKNDPLTVCQKGQDLQQKETLRHEIIHAFLSESGLDANSNGSSCWATNEEMVDWFAIQSPKIFKLYRELGILEDFTDHTESSYKKPRKR